MFMSTLYVIKHSFMDFIIMRTYTNITAVQMYICICADIYISFRAETNDSYFQTM